MKSKAVISVLSKQSGNDDDAIEVVTPGKFYRKEQCYYVVYDETEISGMKGTTTTLKIYPEEFSLIRMGTTSTKMKFRENYKDITLYNTPYGVLELEIETKELKININDNGGEILIDYDLGVSGQESQNNIMKINIDAMS